MTPPVSAHPAAGQDRLSQVLDAFEEQWRVQPRPSLERAWESIRAEDDSAEALAALIKVDLRARFARGESPAVADYFDRFPLLREAHDPMVSLVYEEYCLREEGGRGVDTESFCARYEPWRDSIESQLRYHRMFSRMAVGGDETPPLPRPGDVFLGCRLISELGRGGSGRVYLAEETELGSRKIALKVAPDKGDEASIQGRLDHPHVVQVLWGRTDPATNLRGLGMAFRPGLTLVDVVGRVKPGPGVRRARVLRDVLDPPDASERGEAKEPAGWAGFPARASYARGVAWVVSRLARALAHAHARGILHRDVKPANVLLTRRDGPLLLDFNLASSPDTTDQAAAALRGGTLPYMAPEQLEAFLDDSRWGTVGAAADIYSLGLVMHELLTGRRPEVPDPSLPLPRAIRTLLDGRVRTAFSARAVNPRVPHALQAILDRCLAARPADRYATAAELAEDLDALVAARPLKHARNPSRLERALVAARSHRRAVAVAAGLAGALLVTKLAVFPALSQSRLEQASIEAEQRNDYKAARTLFRAAAWYDAKNPWSYYGMSKCASVLGDAESSLAYAERAVELDREYPRYLPANSRALVYSRRADAYHRKALAIQDRAARRLLKEGRLQVTGRPDPEFVAAGRIYAAAAADVVAARACADRDPLTRLNLDLVAARVEIGLGDVASQRGDYKQSVARFRLALRTLEEAEKLRPPQYRAEFLLSEAADLRRDVTERLAVDEPLLASGR